MAGIRTRFVEVVSRTFQHSRRHRFGLKPVERLATARIISCARRARLGLEPFNELLPKLLRSKLDPTASATAQRRWCLETKRASSVLPRELLESSEQDFGPVVSVTGFLAATLHGA